MFRSTLPAIILSLLAAAIAHPALAEDAPAQTVQPRNVPLRWKLQAGEALRYELTERVTYALVPKQPPIEIALRFNLTLLVRDVAPDGRARATLVLDRLRLAGEGAQGARMRSIDTAKAPPGRALVDPVLIGRPVTFWLTPRGELIDVAVADAKLSPGGERAMEAVRRDSVGAGMLPSYATLYLAPEESLKTLLANVVIPLPEGPVAGAEPWERERIEHNEVFDLRTAKVRYEPAPAGDSAGPRLPERPGDGADAADLAEGDTLPSEVEPLAPGEVSVRMTGAVRQGARGGDTPPLSRGLLAGTYRFDPDAGRVTGGRWIRRLVFEGPARGTKPAVKVVHTTRSTLKLLPPPEEPGE